MAEHFYSEIRYRGKHAVLLVTSDREWKLRYDEGIDFEKHAGKNGYYNNESWGQCYKTGGKEEVFRLTGLAFPPQIVLEPRWLQHRFNVGEAWAKALGYRDANHAALNNDGHWYAMATGALMSWVEQYCKEKTQEFKKIKEELAISAAQLVDPTGVTSFVGAVQSSERGDWLGTTLNLVGIIPLFGVAAKAAKSARLIERISVLSREIIVLNDWLKASKAAFTRSRITMAKGLEGLLTTSRAGASVARFVLKNKGWITKIDPKDMKMLGMLPEEIQALDRLAQKGYYFCIRACNPERVEWLTWAAKAGCRMLAKPLWIKSKSLKEAGYATGLIGWKTHMNMLKVLKKVDPPTGFNPMFLTRAGKTPKAIYRIKAEGHSVLELENAGNASTHFIVDDGEYLILCDAKGAAYVSDLDVNLIQRQLSNGNFGPPGFNIGPPSTVYKGGPYGGDNPEIGKLWQQALGGAHYPPGYVAIQHGELGGTALNPMHASKVEKATGVKFDPALGGVRPPIWKPGDTWDTEKCLVAAPNIESGGGVMNVGYTTDYSKLKAFHEANGGGVFRWDPPPGNTVK